jgi:phosphoenolpyruvate---glycerone phosphotransferase subunit DhaK
MKKAKKVMNDPKNVVPELLEGLVLAYHGQIRKLEGLNGLVKTSLPPGKVGLLIGGGSGHEPLFHGFIGDNMADGAPCGNIFAAPAPDIVLAVTEALDQGNGVLYLYNNYTGDVLNFDMAAEMAADAGIRVRTVLIHDDIASAPPEKKHLRRGIAGDVLIIKVAGGVAAVSQDLEEVVRVTTKACDNTRSMGMALSAGSLPETGEPTFVLADDEIGIGMGVHGERGVGNQKMMPADAIVEQMMVALLADLPFVTGDDVCLLINNMGSTTMMELLIVNRKIRQILSEKGIAVYDTVMGAFATTQEMAGFSISLMKLDAELKRYYDMPAASFGCKWTGSRG